MLRIIALFLLLCKLPLFTRFSSRYVCDWTSIVQVAFVGFSAAALVTRMGPIEALQTHLSDPFNNNIIGEIARLPQTLGVSTPAPSA